MAAESDIKVNQCTVVEWKPSRLPSTDEDCVSSSTFQFQNTQCYFEMFRQLGLRGDIYTLYLRNCISSISKLSLPFYVTVGVCAGADTFFYTSTSVTNLDYHTSIWGDSPAGIRKRMPNFDNYSNLFRLRIVFHNDFKFSHHSQIRKEGEKSVQTPLYLDSSFHFDDISRDFQKLLSDDSSQDVEFRCCGKTFKAQKSILSVRSKVLSTMLRSDMVEGKTGIVEIKDMNDSVFEQFLHYLYTGKLQGQTVESAISLYEAGDKYAVEALKKECACYLTDNLTKENVCKVLVLADCHCDAEFKEKVIQYVLEAKVPFECDYWPDFCEAHPKLSCEVLNRYCLLFGSKESPPGV